VRGETIEFPSASSLLLSSLLLSSLYGRDWKRYCIISVGMRMGLYVWPIKRWPVVVMGGGWAICSSACYFRRFREFSLKGAKRDV
jgi:hypothetical protein